MQLSSNCYNLIKHFEGCKLSAYLCPAKVPTIGWGSTMYMNGSKVKLGDYITPIGADELLAWEVNKKAAVVAAMGLQLNQNQFDAVVCFAFNVGLGALQKSTMAKKIKVNPNDVTIRAEFMRWNKANGVELKGLTTRRKAEADLYFKA
jgi:lysozyme